MSENEIFDMLQKANSELDIKREIDMAYTQGKVDGWREAINYFLAKLKAKPDKDKEQKGK